MSFRIGLGVDMHAFAEGRKLVLAGVTIPDHPGLAGHSDADVVAHAVCDALLGAAALGDIGQHFPDDDPRHEGADSLVLLSECAAMLASREYRVSNVDVTVVAQTPRISPHRDAMRENLARAMGIDAGQVSVKATTAEGMGALGRKEGIMAQAIALIRAGGRHGS